MTTEEVTLFIAGRRFHGWGDVEIQRRLDAISTVSFGAPFEPDRREFRDTFRPFTFKNIDVNVGDLRLFTGTMLGVGPSVDAESRSVSVDGYSLPGVLEDAHVPSSALPVEFRDLTLGQIAERLAEPFGIGVVVEGDDGPAFDQVALKPDEDPQSFLADLAKQRGMVMADNPLGEVVFLRSTAPGRPVVQLREGEPPLSQVSAQFSPQGYYSEITGMAKVKPGRAGSGYTLRNDRLPDKLRPHTFELEDTDAADMPAAVRAKMGRMFGNMVTYSVTVPTWRDPRGSLWRPNTTLTLTAPGAMVYRETELIIRSVTLSQDAESTTAKLDLVLPGSFSGEIPAALPWEE